MTDNRLDVHLGTVAKDLLNEDTNPIVVNDDEWIDVTGVQGLLTINVALECISVIFAFYYWKTLTN